MRQQVTDFRHGLPPQISEYSISDYKVPDTLVHLNLLLVGTIYGVPRQCSAPPAVASGALVCGAGQLSSTMYLTAARACLTPSRPVIGKRTSDPLSTAPGRR